MKEEKTPSVVEVQHQIRANASQLQDYFSDLYAWEKTIHKEDSARKRAAKTAKSPTAIAAPPPRTATIIGVDSNGEKDTNGGRNSTWYVPLIIVQVAVVGVLNFAGFLPGPQDAALKEADEDEGNKRQNKQQSASVQASGTGPSRVTATSNIPAASTTTKTREELEKEEGNAHYKRGDYVAAIKSYTRCLGYNPQNAVVLSNRAMAYLKNREFANAEDDCTLALKSDPAHVKSYSRRGTARNALGKHRLALLDFHRAAMLDPKSRQIQTQLQSTRNVIRTAIKRSPKRTEFSIEVVGESPMAKQTSSEHYDAENKENVGSQQPKTSDTKKIAPPMQQTASILPPSPGTLSVESTVEKTKKTSSAILPKLPKKAPASSYEFGRVWKTLALRGDTEQKSQLINLRAEYLRMIDPPSLRTVFKAGMESDVLCEIFHTLRHAILSSSGDTPVPKEDSSFTLAFANELTKVPRFNMTIMLLSGNEKEDMAWVIKRLGELLKDDNDNEMQEVAKLNKVYELL
ncbi:Polyadenylate-binding protein 1-B [Phytophthora nicotianae]|uniref:RNA polymerase II-associated protein 3 n=2 Tax=Phytophthora nicotianae TaxID=4792 RepID=A0A0W8DQE7_PHYNI|nr:Polyadenylate-binding protein 1-B [Phytophthora nicotianae]